VYETEDANNERGVRLSKDIVKVAGRCVGSLLALCCVCLCDCVACSCCGSCFDRALQTHSLGCCGVGLVRDHVLASFGLFADRLRRPLEPTTVFCVLLAVLCLLCAVVP
jgi:hypothetical protein